ncbi:hypothetical protein P175DRAFT_0500031 [Aspergillus ochraceoroseus IBT 24754]|uniref:Uncharacterized protein n=1 Tax=Aspergillus ochraceoroseus IBT 24754 TaxID=1392256 RepID=A0A2T5M4P6_9EURO|nr:uncharacterized protein P175DRAFT_0500031 [Aspergillus ochraceoroseus IBT 24754]PTU23476.1 hypothetical protein P175DRAFT_0500031 [Aspergillus ochraceoroseus IBT 24754]
MWLRYSLSIPTVMPKPSIRRIPFACRTVEDIRDELDPFLNEARAFRRIDELCNSSEKIYFPQFHGVGYRRSLRQNPASLFTINAF